MKEEKISEKKKQNIGVTTIILRFLIVLVFLGFIGIRGLSLLPGWGNIVDSYGYYGAVVIGQEQMSARLTSGISYAYTQSLAAVLMMVGDAKWMVAIYHILLQMLTLIFMVAGCCLLFEKKAACISGMIVMFSPWIFQSVFFVSPENFYLFFWSVVLFLIGIYFSKGKKSGWCRNNVGEAFLLFLGFVTGVLCIWHYFSFTLIVLLIYAMARNASYVRERIQTQQNVQDMEMLTGKKETSLSSKNEAMPNSSQMLIVLSGFLFGAYCTLMKYTGVTGYFIGEQFKWWLTRLSLFDTYGRWQDIALWLLLHMVLIVIMGIIFTAIQTSRENVREEEEIWQEFKAAENSGTEELSDNETTDIIEAEKELSFEDDWDAVNIYSDNWNDELLPGDNWDVKEHQDWRFDLEIHEEDAEYTDDKERIIELKEDIMKEEWAEIEPQTEERQVVPKEVKLLDNPLPLPKKHVKKVMDFEDAMENDDFDFSFHQDDDFDV